MFNISQILYLFIAKNSGKTYLPKKIVDEVGLQKGIENGDDEVICCLVLKGR
jgi:hypothetical protein